MPPPKGSLTRAFFISRIIIMHLVPQWRRVLRRAWSIRFNLIGGVFAAAEVILPLYQNDIPRGTFAALSGVTVIGGIVARLVAPKGITNAPDENED